ncbi:MAG TPA: phospho-N-acetylmuramoyl-pentapeptide-transferase, partial [Tepidisphaeraceae bacterium]|nr:phospho-N-acetylmuramoyl-pentapeptide-transferase [Tepidisphaeraceae bacterium]
MIYLLVKSHLQWLEAHGLGFLRLFTDVGFQTTAAVIVSFMLVLVAAPAVIAWLRRMKIGDQPNFDQAQVNAMMEAKRGTPTMGGILIIGAIALTTLLLADMRNFYVQMALVCLVWLGGVGMADDWLKLTAAHRSGTRQGLTSLEKVLFQLGLAAVLAVFTYHHGRDIPETHTLYFPFAKPSIASVKLGLGAFVVLSMLVLVGSSNAVNLTDGLDGLAAGTMAIVSFTFLGLALIIGNLQWSGALLFHYVKAADQMAVLAGAMGGACLGFLWFNCNPARVFMGDTGSLALGGLIGYIAIVIRQELMLFVVGGIFVAEALSVMLQVSYFKYTKRKYGQGRRILLMSPLHHHFQR